MVCPTGPGGFVFQWFAQRVWRGFGFFLQWSAQRAREDSFFNCSTNGSGGVSFFFQWSAQRAREDSFFNGSPNGSGGVLDFFQWCAQRVWRGFGILFQWSAQRARGDSFFNGSPNGSHLGRFGWLRSRGPCQGGTSGGTQPRLRSVTSWPRGPWQFRSWLRGSPRAPRAPGRDPPRLRSVGHPGYLGHLGVSYGRARLRLTSTIKRTQFFTCRLRTSTRPHCLP